MGTPALRSSTVDVAAAWVAWLGGRPQTTVRARLADLSALGRFVAEQTPDRVSMPDARAVAAQLAEISPGRCRALIAAWHTSQVRSGLTGTTIARRVSTVASWLAELGEHGLPWSVRLPRPSVASYQQRSCPSWPKVDALVSELTAAARWRELAALLLLSDVGLRRAEACSLVAGDVDAGPPPSVRVLRKGGRVVSRTLSARAAAAIERALEGRTRGPLLVSARGRGMSESGLAAWLGRVLGSTPHRMRNAGASKLYRDTHDSELVRGWLDHRNLSTTQRYVELLEDSAGDATRLLAGE
jgi:site-specific recombinase XerD